MQNTNTINNKKIGAAVVGLGVGEQHAIKYLSMKECDYLVVYDIDTEKTQTIAQKLRCDKADSFDQIINDPRIHVISIASFDDDHCEQVIAGLNAKKHIFVEKPMCSTFEELKAIKGAWLKHKGNIKLFSNHILRAAPIYIWLREKIQANEFGDIYAFDGEYLYGRIWKITQGWRKNEKKYTGMNSGGLHMIDLMLWLTGQRPSSVFTVGNRICTKDTDFKSNDFMTSLFRFPSGMVGRISANLGCVHEHHHIMRIFGTKATFIYDDAGPRLHTTRDPAVKAAKIDIKTLPSHKGDLIPPFVKAIYNNQSYDNYTRELIDDISITTACDKSQMLETEVRIEYI